MKWNLKKKIKDLKYYTKKALVNWYQNYIFVFAFDISPSDPGVLHSSLFVVLP